MTDKLDRPVFLTVLCILTFIGSGYSALSALISLLTEPLVEQSMAQMEEVMLELDAASADVPWLENFLFAYIDVMENMMDHYVEMNLTSFLGYALALTGAIFMFKLKNIGFHMYLASQLLLTMVPLIFMGFNIVGFVTAAVGGFFNILFVILYGLNLKHLR